MWVEYKRTKSLIVAESWKKVLDGEGLPAKIMPVGDILDWSEQTPFVVMVPKGREHVADEIVRKL